MLISDSEELKKRLDYIKEYISKSKEQVGEQTDSYKQLVDCLLVESVETENLESLKIVLDWMEDEDPDLKRLTRMAKKFDGNADHDMKTNNLAMIRAAEKNNFDMIAAFMKSEFIIDASHIKQAREEKKKKINERKDRFPLLFRRSADRCKEDILFHFRLFNATTKPAFLTTNLRYKIERENSDFDDYWDMEKDVINNFQGEEEREFQGSFKNDDPVTESFNNVYIARSLGREYVEYKNKFQSVVDENRSFAVTMLDLCKSNEEAERFLSFDLKMENSDITNTAYPRLEVALQTRNINFVAHDFCQQLLRE